LTFVGYGGSAPLGEEVRNPHRTISRAVMIAIIGMAIFYLFMGYAVTVGWGIHRMAAFAALPLPVMTLVATKLGALWFWVVAVLLLNSVLGSGLAQHNAQARVLYSLARDRFVISPALAVTHPRFKTPYRSIAVETTMTVLLTMGLGLWLGAYGGFLLLGAFITLGNLFVHIVANYSLPKYFRRIGEFRWLYHWLIPWFATVLFLFPIYFSIFPVPAFPSNLPPYFLAAWLLLDNMTAPAPTSCIFRGLH